jgi:two-component system alkaline phosphatase synthesis response regulator PhoP
MKTELKVLIVDDEIDEVQELSSILIRNNYEVKFGLNGEEGLAILEGYIPDIIITDILMPKMNGIEMVRQIKKIDHLNAIPVFFLSGTSDDVHVLSAMSAGGAFYLSKPVVPELIISEIEAVFIILKNIKKTEPQYLNSELFPL